MLTKAQRKSTECCRRSLMSRVEFSGRWVVLFHFMARCDTPIAMETAAVYMSSEVM